jgi:hypothetical protein
VWTSNVSKTPGSWCLTRFAYRLSFTSSGNLILTDVAAQNKTIWQANTDPFGNQMTLSTRALVSVHGCPSENGVPKCQTMWNSKAQTTAGTRWTKFEIQIGQGIQSNEACWTVSAYPSGGSGWESSGVVFPSNAGQCRYTEEMGGGGGGGGGFEPF